MPVVAVINRKGGSGKSTLATNLAGHCAGNGKRVMLGDVDRQQSSLGWLRRRASRPEAESAPIVGWAVDTRSVMRPPGGITHVVLDTPGGLRNFDLARVVMNADAILMPVCDSAFDRESAADCHAELMTLNRVASGRCKVAVVGMRIDARTKGAARLEAWATQQGLPYLGAIRDSQLYVRSAEQGLTLFDLPAPKVDADLAQWRPVLAWLEAAWKAADRARASEVLSTPPIALQPKATSPGRAMVATPSAAASTPDATPAPPPALPAASRPSRGTVRPGPGDRFGWLFNVFRSTT
jgi:chromosome partitioning protein